MFYEETEIDDMLKCGQCRLRFDEPRILPCGQTICNSCLETTLSSVDKKLNSFSCSLCHETHETKNEFPVNELIKRFLKKSPIDVSRGKLVEDFKRNLKDIVESKQFLETRLNNSVDTVQAYSLQLRGELDLARELVIREIHKHSDEMLKEINDYEVKTIGTIKIDRAARDEYERMVAELDKFYVAGTRYLQGSEIKDGEVTVALKNEADFKKDELNSIIFNKQKIWFESVKSIDRSFLGQIRFRKLNSYDLKEFREIDLGIILQSDSFSHIEIVPEFHDAFSVFYLRNSKLKQSKINKYLKATEPLRASYIIVRKFKKCKESVVVFGVDGCRKNRLFLLDTNLKAIKNSCVITDITVGPNRPTVLSISDKNIYLYNNHQLKIYDKGLLFVKEIGQVIHRENPFYLPKYLKQFECRNGKYICLDHTGVRIMGEDNGQYVSSIDIDADNFLFDSMNNIVLLNKKTEQLDYFYSDGNLIQSINVENYREGLVLESFSMNDDPIFFDKTKKSLHYI